MASAVALGVAPTERAPSVLPAAGEPRLAEAPPALDESSPTNRKEPNFKELTERFDSLLLEGAELLNMSADERRAATLEELPADVRKRVEGLEKGGGERQQCSGAPCDILYILLNKLILTTVLTVY